MPPLLHLIPSLVTLAAGLLCLADMARYHLPRARRKEAR